jgi:hypothetical protein
VVAAVGAIVGDAWRLPNEWLLVPNRLIWVLLVLPAVDREVPVVPGNVAVQLGTQEPRGPSEQLPQAPSGALAAANAAARSPGTSYSHTRTNTPAFDHRPRRLRGQTAR